MFFRNIHKSLHRHQLPLSIRSRTFTFCYWFVTRNLHAGGITECKKIISIAEAFDVAAAPHCPLGPIAACLQVDATCHNAFIQEQSLGIHYNEGSDLLDYIVDKNVFHYENGYVQIPDTPGLGIEVNEDLVREMAAKGHNWRNPLWRHQDGSALPFAGQRD